VRIRTVLALVAGFCAAAACNRAPDAAPPAVAEGEAGWVARTALYEVFVRQFSPQGNFRGVTEGLDRIQAVGAEVVWLMPVHPIGVAERKGTLGSPYSISDYRAINSDFGTEADFRALVDAVHARGMKVIIDWVPNHTAWDHPWVRERPDFYTRNDAGQMTHPRDNDGNLTDWTDVVELDYDNPEMRRAMIAEMRHWLETFGIDGFRVDMAGMVPDQFWQEAIPELRAAGATLLIAEWEDPKMIGLGFDLVYSWPTFHRLKAVWQGEPASSWMETVEAEMQGMPKGGLRMRFTTNHDETAWDDTPLGLFAGPAGACAAFVAVALLPGPPLIYNGQEVESAQRIPLFEREAVEWNQPGAEEARAFYRRVIDLSRTHGAFATGELRAVRTDAEADVIAYRRGDAVVLVNPRARPVRVTAADINFDGARDLLGGGITHEGATVTLPAHGAAVLELTRGAVAQR
jgi:glycosidase